MGLKDLCQQLGAEYSVRHRVTDNHLTVSLYMNKEKVWAHRPGMDINTLSGLFKEVYADAIEDILPNSPFSLDKPEEK